MKVLIVAGETLGATLASGFADSDDVTKLTTEEFTEKVANEAGFDESLSAYDVFAVNATTEEALLSIVNFLDANLDTGWQLIVACIRVKVIKKILPKGCSSVILRDITPASVKEAFNKLYVLSS